MAYKIKRLGDISFSGSYTVEAAIIISFCFLIFGMAIALSYEIFTSVLEYVEYKENSFDAVHYFRLKEGAMGMIHAIFK